MDWAKAEEPDYKNTPGPTQPSTYSLADDETARANYAQALAEATTYTPGMKGATVTGSTIDRTHDLAARGYQSDLAGKLGAIVAGGPGGVAAPSAYQQMSYAQAANNAFAATRATSPNSIAGAMRTAGNANASAAQGAEARIAALKAQEQIAAGNALHGTLAGMRAQDFGVANDQARLTAGANVANANYAQGAVMANQQAWQAAHGIRRDALGGAVGYDQDAFNDAMARRRALSGDKSWRDQFAYGKDLREDAFNSRLMDSGGSIAGYLSTMDSEKKPPSYSSDRRAKTGIRSGEDELRALLDAAFLYGGE